MLTILPFHSEYNHAAGVPADPSPTNWPLGRARSDKVRLRLRSTRLSPAIRPDDKRFRSGFIDAGIRIDYRDFAALADHLSCFEPATRLLPAKASFQQDRADRVFTDFRQAIRRFAQRLAQGSQRPSGRAIRLRMRFLAGFLQDPFALGGSIFRSMTASVPGLNGIQTFLIEALHQMGDGIPRFPPRKPGCFLILVAFGYRENLFGPCYMIGWFTLGATDAF